MPEPIDEFWEQEKAREIAERGKQTDPTACGTCRGRVEAGQQVKHDECAQRATLMEAPDHPGYEVITTMTEAEVAALPPRFHVPVFMESCTPKAWVCAVCWGDGWVSQWPCATAVQHGTQVFTPQYEAETARDRMIGELDKLRNELAEVKASNDPRLRCLIVKAAPDRDLYVGWSGICDMPAGAWTRAEAIEYGFPPSRLDRADKNGSSDMSHGDGHWDDAGWVAEQRGWLKRDRIGDYALLYIGGNTSAAFDLLEPFEGETAVRR